LAPGVGSKKTRFRSLGTKLGLDEIKLDGNMVVLPQQWAIEGSVICGTGRSGNRPKAVLKMTGKFRKRSFGRDEKGSLGSRGAADY